MMTTCNDAEDLSRYYIAHLQGKAHSAMQITKHHHIFIAVIVTAAVSAGFTYILVAYQWQSQPLLTAVAQNRKEAGEPEVELATVH